MLFTDAIFIFYFFPLALLAHRVAVSFGAARRYGAVPGLVFFAFTLVFCAWKQPWWLVPLALTIGGQWFWGELVHRTALPFWRRFYLLAGVAQCLGLLFLCKDIPTLLFDHPWLTPYLPHLEQASRAGNSLPAGISFYELEAISYLVDIYRRHVTPPRNPVKLLAFIGMFPRFVAGPIVRYRQIEEQMDDYRGMDLERGLFLCAIGLVLKIAFADSFALHVRYAFGRPDAPDFFSAWIGSVAYAMQLYFDFAGYAFIAIGIGRCFGFEFGRNFNCPYTADSMSNFWWRWHITLSRWIRDYIFFPLMLPATRRSRAYFFAMFALLWLLVGLWHGPRATFLVCYLWFGTWSWLESVLPTRRYPQFVRRGLTLGIVLVGWVLLRSADLGEAGRILRALVTPWDQPGRFNPAGILSQPLAAVLGAIGLIYCFGLEPRFDAYAWKGRLGWLGAPLLAGLVLLCLMLSFSWRTIPFLYFQF